jgi:hypothetical protein
MNDPAAARWEEIKRANHRASSVTSGLGIEVFQKRLVWYDFEKDKNTRGLW